MRLVDDTRDRGHVKRTELLRREFVQRYFGGEFVSLPAYGCIITVLKMSCDRSGRSDTGRTRARAHACIRLVRRDRFTG